MKMERMNPNEMKKKPPMAVQRKVKSTCVSEESAIRCIYQHIIYVFNTSVSRVPNLHIAFNYIEVSLGINPKHQQTQPYKLVKTTG